MHTPMGFEPVDKFFFPQAMHTTTHQIIHDIITRGNTIEHATYQRLLCLFIDGLKAKMCFLLHGAHDNGIFCTSQQDKSCPNYPKLKQYARRWMALLPVQLLKKHSLGAKICVCLFLRIYLNDWL